MTSHPPPWRLVGLACAVVLLVPRASSAAGEVALAKQLYRDLREQATAQGCSDDRLPPQLTIDAQDFTVNASAMFDAERRPRIVANQGLVEFNGLTAYLVAQTEREEQWRAFKVVIAKAQRADDPLRAKDGWPDWRAATRPWAWKALFLSRMAFDLAHEMAHLCLGHRRGALSEGDRRSFTDDEGHVQRTLEPAVLVGELSGSHAPATQPSADLEEAADRWAADLLQRAHEDLGVTTIEGTISAVAELGILDAVKGRSSLRTGSGLSWVHPVGHDRFNRAYQRFNVFGESIPYIDRVEKLILCLERDDKPLEHFRALVEARTTICSSPVAIAAGDLMSTLPVPLVRDPRPPSKVEVAVVRSRAVPLIARGKNSEGLVWLSKVRDAGMPGLLPVSKWASDVDSGEAYTIDFQKAAEGGSFEVLVDGKRVGSGMFGANGAPVLSTESKGLSVSGTTLQVSVARPKSATKGAGPKSKRGPP